MTQTIIDIGPVAGALGAEIRGVDLTKTLSDECFDAIKAAYDRYGVIFFRDQHLSPEDHITFAERWGPININRFFVPVPDYPMIAEVRKEPDTTENIGGAWHTDHSYDQIPAMGSILHALETPPRGGDTMFASMSAAYESLSEGLKATLGGLSAHHSSRHAFGAEASAKRRNAGAAPLLNDHLATQDAIHPVILTHPRTGRKGIFVNRAFTTHFVGWTPQESAPLLAMLYDHCAKAEFTCRFQWQPGSVAFWDNLATWHLAVNDYAGESRLMHRITVEGTPLGSD